MADLITTVRRFFDEDDWQYTQTGTALRLAFGGKSGDWNCIAQIRERAGQVLFYSLAPFTVPKGARAEMMEFVTRANFGMYFGCFELELDTGDVRFRTSLDVEGDEGNLTAGMIKHLVYQNVLTMERYLPGIRDVAEKNVPGAQAIKAIEG